MNSHDLKVAADGASLTVLFTGVMGWLNPMVTLIGGLLGIVYVSLRIYETDTVQKLLRKPDAV